MLLIGAAPLAAQESLQHDAEIRYNTMVSVQEHEGADDPDALLAAAEAEAKAAAGGISVGAGETFLPLVHLMVLACLSVCTVQPILEVLHCHIRDRAASAKDDGEK